MNNFESESFSKALNHYGFSSHDAKVVKAILEGEDAYNQEDIICISEHNLTLLRKLGWIRQVRCATNAAGLKISNWK